MRHVKTPEQIGQECGYKSSELQYAATVGKLGAKIEMIASELDHLWVRVGLEKEDCLRTLLNIEDLVKDVLIDE